ncbi:DUF4352 domain-containing protein [Streptomyces tauricus]|uniref:DUF4352 domain-containing protein n=1 Tax=Streptomyces tauricus TaxID=68274 RepID=UPI0033DF6A7B
MTALTDVTIERSVTKPPQPHISHTTVAMIPSHTNTPEGYMRTRITATALAAAVCLALTGCLPDEEVSTTPKASAESAGDAGKKDTKDAAVGDTLSLKGTEDGEQLDVTLKKWLPTAPGSNEFNVPTDGKRWAAAQFELINTGSKVYADAPSNGAKAVDSEGQRFDSWFGEIAAGPGMSSDVSMPKGEKTLGWIVFEVPKNSKIVTVQFAMNSGFSNQTGQWTVK